MFSNVIECKGANVTARLKLLILAILSTTVLMSCAQGSRVLKTPESSTIGNNLDLNPPKRLNVKKVSENGALLASMRKAMTVMRGNSNAAQDSVEFVNSLRFWANIHGFVGNTEDDPEATDYLQTVVRRSGSCVDSYTGFLGDSTKAIEACANIFKQVDTEYQTNDFTQDMWGTCQHTSYSPPGWKFTPRFLPWHRLYLYYFEKTLRKTSGDPLLSLPYWDYFDYLTTVQQDNAEQNGQAQQNIELPPIVISAQDPTPQTNSLYDSLRSFGLNEQVTSIDPSVASAADAFAHTEFVDFSNALEDTPHGAMHCATGDGCSIPHMGWVPLAGNDPLFYMHHSNIDRLWQCWLNEKAQGETITLQWAKDNLGMPESWYDIGYYFADENGEKVYKTIADAFSPEVLSVSYSQEVDCQLDISGSTSTQARKNAQELATKLKSVPTEAKVYSSGQVILQPYAVDVSLKESSTQSEITKNLLKEYEGKRGIWLILDDVTVNHNPYFTFNVYVSNKNQASKKVSVGVFNFFGFGSNHGHGGSDHKERIANDNMGRKAYFISDDLSELKFNSIKDVQVKIEPQAYTSGGKINQNRINLVTIGSVHVVRSP